MDRFGAGIGQIGVVVAEFGGVGRFGAGNGQVGVVTAGFGGGQV